ncbi:MAG: GNAT family N-acetyltransferase, partial [Candidatus Poribacteria bacterium]
IRRGELQKQIAWSTVQLGNLITAYKRSSGRRLSATFAVIQMSEVLSYCFIREGIVGDVFTREDKRRLGLGQSVLSAAIEWGLEFKEEVLYSMLKSNTASSALCKSVGFKFWFEFFKYRARPL